MTRTGRSPVLAAPPPGRTRSGLCPQKATAMTTTASLLLTLADRAEGAIQPAARGAATAGTLRALAAISGLPPVRPADLIAALVLLGQHRHEDPPPVAARRITVRELADLVPDGVAQIAEVTASALLLWAAFTRIPGAGPRIDAIQATARRELAVLLGRAEASTVLAFALAAPPAAPAPFEVPKPSRREPGITPRVLTPQGPDMTDAEITERANAAIADARASKASLAYLDLGIDPMVAGRDGGMLAARAMQMLRAVGYECQLDRTCAIEITL